MSISQVEHCCASHQGIDRFRFKITACVSYYCSAPFCSHLEVVRWLRPDVSRTNELPLMMSMPAKQNKHRRAVSDRRVRQDTHEHTSCARAQKVYSKVCRSVRSNIAARPIRGLTDLVFKSRLGMDIVAIARARTLHGKHEFALARVELLTSGHVRTW